MTGEWSNDQCLKLIDLYEKHPVLWNTKHNYYYSKTKKLEAWDDIADELQDDVKIVKRKMQSLLGSFRAQKSKGRKFIESEKGLNEVYKSKWFAFERMQFLFDKDESQSNANFDNDNLNIVKDEYVTEETECNLSTDIDIEIKHNLVENIDEENVVVHKNETGIKRRKKSGDGPKIDETLKLLEETRINYTPFPNDRFATYGQHVANKLRLYSSKTQAIVEHLINNILFEADIGHYDSTAFVNYQLPQYRPSHTQLFTSSPNDSHTATSTPSLTD